MNIWIVVDHSNFFISLRIFLPRRGPLCVVVLIDFFDMWVEGDG